MERENKSREYTQNEVKLQFVQYVKECVKYWEDQEEGPCLPSKLEGLAGSILCAIDGCGSTLPKYILAPNPHSEHKEFFKNEGENYYSENYKSRIKCDISGNPHDLLDEELDIEA